MNEEVTVASNIEDETLGNSHFNQSCTILACRENETLLQCITRQEYFCLYVAEIEDDKIGKMTYKMDKLKTEE